MPRVHVAPDCQLCYELHGSGTALLFLGATAYPAAIWKPYQVPALSSEMILDWVRR